MRASEQIIIFGGGGGGLPSWIPTVAGTVASLYADFSTEGGENRYWYVGVRYANATAWIDALGGTISRASSATDLIPASPSGYAYSTYGSGVARVVSGTGILIEGSRTNLFLNSNAPATQDISLGTGTFTLWVNGSGSVTCTAGTATGSGFGAASNGVPRTFTITVAGTVTFTVSGSLNFAQVESGPIGSSAIITGGTSATRAADDIIAPSAPWLSSVGTFYARHRIDTNFTYPGAFMLNASGEPTGSQGVAMRANDGSMNARDAVANNEIDPSVGPVIGSFNKAAFQFDTAWHLAGSLNGAAVRSAAASTITPPTASLYLGHQNAGGGDTYLFGWLKEFAFIPAQASNADLQRLTA